MLAKTPPKVQGITKMILPHLMQDFSRISEEDLRNGLVTVQMMISHVLNPITMEVIPPANDNSQ